jgi:Tol biopolymer transport system component
MRTWLQIVLLAALVLAAGLAALYWRRAPELIEVSPFDGAVAAPAASALRLVFSQPMQAETVQERLSIEPATPGSYVWQGNTLVFSPEAPWPAGTLVNVRLAAGAKAQGWLPASPAKAYDWSFTIRQPRLAYLAPAQGPASLYLLDPQSGESRLLYESAGGVQDYTLSANGAAIYLSERIGDSGSAIYRLDLAESSPEQPPAAPALVYDCPQALCRAAAVSPLGDRLAFERTPFPGAAEAGLPQVWILDLLQPGEPRLAGAPLHQTLQPAWSPDGVLSFYDSTSQAYVFLEPNYGGTVEFPNQTGQGGDWRAGGREFVAAEIEFLRVSETVTNLDALANSHLLLFNRIDGSIQDLTPGDDLEDAAPAFSPDGASLAFARKSLDPQRWTQGRQLWLLDLASGEARQLTNEPVQNHFAFAWSPAGDQIAYQRFDQTVLVEPPELWLINVLSGRAFRLLKGGYAPQWIP